jgi:hypothetical protein
LSAPKVCGRAYSLLASNAPAARISAEIARRPRDCIYCIGINVGRSVPLSLRGGLTSKIHAVVDTNGLPVHLALTPGEAHDNRLSQVR